MKSKVELRKEILQIRDALSQEERQKKSRQIVEKVIAYKSFREADKILLFASHKSEVDTTEIFATAHQMKKKVYFPKVIQKEMEFYQVHHEKELLEGYRGIREPEIDETKKFIPQSEDKVVVIMPGAVFDTERNRIGYGGGYYDKFLRYIEEKITQGNLCKIAVAFDCQLIEKGKIPKEKHDIRPDYVLTETKMVL